MAATRAQKTVRGRKNYGRNYERGRAGERRAAATLRRAGYSVSISPGSAGFSDVIAKKGGKTRRIQVTCLWAYKEIVGTDTETQRRILWQSVNSRC